ncbi:hypothetical protein EYR40_010399 [Pleurotus pulmonarius]|nr:hypothetical protein EYR36_010209 [Pleurotus pulmonarius]KAF4588844.1 hypothetical protein EYR40_010399 [Pleurotus pulmonarius]
MDLVQTSIASPEYPPDTLALPGAERLGPLLQITENAVRGTIGNNDAIENTGDAYANAGILMVIMDYLRSSAKTELHYDDSKMYACAAYLHGRLIRNDTLARIYYEQGHKDPFKLAISPIDREKFRLWKEGGLIGNAPKVLADLFEANVWLVHKILGFSNLHMYLRSLFLPLLPPAITMFEDAYRNTYKSDPLAGEPNYNPSDFFLNRIYKYREVAAATIESRHAECLLERLSDHSEALKITMRDLGRLLESGTPAKFDDQGRIQGVHKFLQLEGHTALRFSLARAHDRLYPLHQSVVKNAAGFQTRLLGLASSDICLQYLVNILNIECRVQGAALQPRSAAELFVASIAMLQAEDQMSFAAVMGELSVQLIQAAFSALNDSGHTVLPLAPLDHNEVNTLPRTSTGRPVKSLPPKKLHQASDPKMGR